jgi:hypothetical protein
LQEERAEIKECLRQDPQGNYRLNHGENLNKVIIMFEGIEERDKVNPPFFYVEMKSIINWIMITDIDTWRENKIERRQATTLIY